MVGHVIEIADKGEGREYGEGDGNGLRLLYSCIVRLSECSLIVLRIIFGTRHVAISKRLWTSFK
jgi:hypothetical protein